MQMTAPSLAPWLNKAIASNGRPVHENFRDWFGISQILDGNGLPLEVFHGTRASFSRFEPSESGLFGPGIYLTDNLEDAEQYLGDENDVLRVYVRMERPFFTLADYGPGEAIDLDTPAVPFVRELFGARADEVLAQMGDGGALGAVVRDELERMGHDGVVVVWPAVAGHPQMRHFVALSSSQIKSAAANSGVYDLLSDDIYDTASRPSADSTPPRPRGVRP